jgi:hypothetical protein
MNPLVAAMMELARDSAIELAGRSLKEGRDRVFVVIACEQQADGVTTAVGTGVGHSQALVPDCRAILETALGTIGHGLPS